MTDTQPAMSYPTKAQYADWKQEASERDMSVSEWIQGMVEAGRKKVESVEIEPDETRRELRAERNRLKSELEAAREAISRLEEQAHTAERETILSFLDENPGASREEIKTAVVASAPERVDNHIERLGDEIQYQDGGYYRT